VESRELVSQILFVIVLYQRRFESTSIYALYKALSQSSSQCLFFVYDNSAAEDPTNYNNVIYHHDAANNGVSTAYNKGLQLAIQKKRTWLMLLDQDTIVPSEYLDEVSHSMTTCPGYEVFVPQLVSGSIQISPFKWFAGRGWPTSNVGRTLSLKNFRFANSGAIISTALLSKVDGFDTTMPLDFSDIDLGQRLQKAGAAVVVVPSILQHGFSGHETLSYKQSESRYHYYLRGAVAMGNKHGHTLIIFGWSFVRALKLSIYYRRLSFFRILMRQFFYG
jgi:GT2 family glycosyltransferase